MFSLNRLREDGMTGVLWFRFWLGILLFIVVMAIESVEPDPKIKAPLFALVSAAGLAIGIIHPNGSPMAQVIRILILGVSAATGVGAAWQWLISVDPAQYWRVVGGVLAMVSLLTLLGSVLREMESLAGIMAEARKKRQK